MKLAPVLLALTLGLFGSRAAAQTTWYVDVGGTPPGTGTPEDPYTDLQDAIGQGATEHGDTILVAPGTYAGPIDYLGKALVIRAVAGPDHTLLALPANGTGVRMDAFPECALEGFAITGATQLGSLAVHVVFGTGARVTRCVVYGNRVAFGNDYDLWLSESTVVDNEVAIYTTLASLEFLANSIVWNNVDIGGLTPESADVRFCAGLSDEYTGRGNVIGDPGLFDAAGGDFHPTSSSPCRDAGDPTSPLDPDGSRVDIGAFTYDPLWPYPAPTNYCTALPNSTGSATSIAWSGSTSVARNDFTLLASFLPPLQTGIFIYSPDQAQTPLGNGNLCLGTTTQGFINRLPGGQADSFGFLTVPIDLASPPIPPSSITPGSTWSFQAWHRDAVGAGFNFSDGLEVLFAP